MEVGEQVGGFRSVDGVVGWLLGPDTDIVRRVAKGEGEEYRPLLPELLLSA